MWSPIVLLAAKGLGSSACPPQRPEEVPGLSQEVGARPGSLALFLKRLSGLTDGVKESWDLLFQFIAIMGVRVGMYQSENPSVISFHTLLWFLGVKVRSPVFGGKHLYPLIHHTGPYLEILLVRF